MGSTSPMRDFEVHQDNRLLGWLRTSQLPAVGGDGRGKGRDCLPGGESAGFIFHEVLISECSYAPRSLSQPLQPTGSVYGTPCINAYQNLLIESLCGSVSLLTGTSL